MSLQPVTLLKMLNLFDTETSEVNLFGPCEAVLIDKDLKEFSKLPSIFVDGGIRHKTNSFKSFALIGDKDSGGGEFDIKFSKDKDFSDLKGVLDLLPKNIKKINLFGFLGGDLDHQLMVFGDFHHWLNTSDKRELNFWQGQGFNSFGRSMGKWEFNLGCRDFSIINLEETTFQVSGAIKYPVREFRSFSLLNSNLLHNEANGAFQVSSDRPFFIL